MNAALKWKLVAGFVLAFLAGGATGGFLVASQARHRQTDFAQHRHSLAERMRGQLQVELNLTPEQIQKTAPIFDRAVNELEKIRAETGARVREVMAETRQALAPELSDAQRTKLEALTTHPRLNRGPQNPPRHRESPPPN